MIRQCLAGAAAFAMIASAALAQPAPNSNGPSAQSGAAASKPISKSRHHGKKPVESYEWTEDTWTETHPVAPPVVEHQTTVVQAPPIVTTRRTTTTTDSEH